MTVTTIEYADRLEVSVNGRPVAFVPLYVLDGLRAHDGGAHQLRPARQLMEEIDRREHPRIGAEPF